MTFHSFDKSLKEFCFFMKPKSILEFGTGHSTGIFLDFTDAKITSCETNSFWFEKYREQFHSDRLEIILRNPGWDIKSIKDNNGFKKYDIIFIDGGDRIAALKESFNFIDNNGIVFLHDAHREEYEKGIRIYPFIYFTERHSVILCKSKTLFDNIKNVIKPDYSCNCRYCSSTERRIYFNKYLD